MLNYFRNISCCVAVLTLVFFLTLSFAATAEEKNAEKTTLPLRIAVVSFQYMPLEDGHGNSVICPLCGVGSSRGKVLKGSEKLVEEIFLDKLHELKEVELIPSDKVQDVYKRITSESLKEPLVSILKKAGNELGADVLAVGYVYRYSERVGYKYSSEHPASVVFEIHLINTSDGSIIWRGFFDKTQKSLMEDVLQIFSFFKGGGKWITVRQLTQQGMDEIFKTFPMVKH